MAVIDKEAEVFEIVLDGTVSDSQAVRDVIFDIVRTKGGFRIIKSNLSFEHGPVVVGRGSDLGELSLLQTELVRAGGKVSMVRSVRNSVKGPALTPGFSDFCRKYASGIAESLRSLDFSQVESLAQDILLARERRSQIFIFGNGGSAANASHFANDFSKPRFADPRSLFRVISLTDNISHISAIANDQGYDSVFASQLRALVQPDDIVIAISSSGNSVNVIKAIELARAEGATTYAIVGFDGGRLMEVAEKPIYIPSKKGQYGFMEDVTLILTHMVSVYLYERDSERFT